MRIAISGFSSLLGTFLTKILAESGHQVFALGRNQNVSMRDVEFVQFDLDDSMREIERLIRSLNLDAFIHLALKADRSQNEFYQSSNTSRTELIADELSRSGGVFILISSVMAAFPSVSNYARVRNEMEATLSHRNVSVVRIGMIPNPELDPTLAAVGKVGEKFGFLLAPTGTVWVSEATDIVRTVLHLLSSDTTGTFSTALRRVELAGILGGETFPHLHVVRVPRLIIASLLKLVEVVQRQLKLPSRLNSQGLGALGIEKLLRENVRARYTLLPPAGAWDSALPGWQEPGTEISSELKCLR